MNGVATSTYASLPPAIALVLSRTPLRSWSAYAVILDEAEGGTRLFARGELAPWLRAQDLGDLADEAAARAARPSTGPLLLILGRDRPRFHVLGGERRGPGSPRSRTRP